MDTTPNPYNMRSYIDATDWQAVEQADEIQLAHQLITQFKSSYASIAELPRYSNWLSQMTRSSESILFNCSEAWGKGRGFFAGSLWVARAEAFEFCGGLLIGPKEVCEPLKPLALDVIRAINKRIKSIPSKPVHDYS